MASSSIFSQFRSYAIKLLVARLKPKLGPLLKQQQLDWSDVLPALELIDSRQELQAAMDEPEAFLTRLADAATPAAIKLLVARLKPKPRA